MGPTPLCPDCSTATARIRVEGEDVWRCTAAGCTRRTYGTGNLDDDLDLPPFSEADADGAVIVYYGTGEIDVETTGELAAQDGSDEDAELDGDAEMPGWQAPAEQKSS
ncbi:hypothetical protein [Streptomyces bacillaris]|uniref:hypothetical protein n=1 Tax=Streptomyces bacillaris TaxID=68179 RepID=UPI0034604FBF